MQSLLLQGTEIRTAGTLQAVLRLPVLRTSLQAAFGAPAMGVTGKGGCDGKQLGRREEVQVGGTARAHAARLEDPPLGSPPTPSCRLKAASAGTDTDGRDWQQLRLGACRVPSWNEGETCPAMRSRRWHHRVPQGAERRVPGHSKLCKQNMGWEARQPGPVPGGPRPLPWAGGLSRPGSGTGWEWSTRCWESYPYKSPGDVESRHLPCSLSRAPV